jgi:hypothetical protein
LGARAHQAEVVPQGVKVDGGLDGTGHGGGIVAGACYKPDIEPRCSKQQYPVRR